MFEDITRGGYRFHYYFNAGVNKKTCIADEEGSDVFNEDTDEYIGQISGVTPDEIEEMTETDFYNLLEDNYIC